MSHAIKAKAKKIGPRRKPLDISGFPYTDYQTGVQKCFWFICDTKIVYQHQNIQKTMLWLSKENNFQFEIKLFLPGN